MTTYTSNTNPSDHKTYEDRIKNVDLIWCNQVVSILEKFCLKEDISVNDIGCNYGQLYKEIKRRGLEKKINYNGYDIDNLFLDMAKNAFPESANKFIQLDVERERLDKREITICSATFEHLDDPGDSLKKMLSATSRHMILRTFVGDKSIKFVQGDKRIVDTPYNINQFNLFDLGKVFFEEGFSFCCLKDVATGSVRKEIGISSGVFRTMFLIVGTKNPDV